MSSTHVWSLITFLLFLDKLTALWKKFDKSLNRDKRLVSTDMLQCYANLCLNNQQVAGICPVATLSTLMHCLMNALNRNSKTTSDVIGLCLKVCEVSALQQ